MNSIIYTFILLFGLQANTVLSQKSSNDLDNLKSKGKALLFYEHQYDKAIEKFFEALSIAEAQNDTLERAILLNLIGEANRQTKNSEYTHKYVLEADQIISSIKNPSQEVKENIGSIKTNLALNYHRRKEYSKSIILFKKILAQYSQSTYDSSRTWNNMGRTYSACGLYDSAIIVLDLAAPLRERINNPYHSAFAFKEYATTYRKLENFEKSIEYGLKVLNIGLEINEPRHTEDAYHNLRDAYMAWGKYKEGVEYCKKQISLMQKMYDIKQQEIISEMQTKYEVAQKDNEIMQLEYQQIIAEKTKSTLITIICLVLIMSFLLVMYFRNAIRKQQIQKKLTQTELDLHQKQLAEKQQQLTHFVKIIQEKNKLIEVYEGQTILDEAKKEALLPKLYESVILTEEDWESFKKTFENVYENFFGKLKSVKSSITTSEMRLSALMKLNLSTREISSTLGISPDSVTKAKYRIKKKLELQSNKELAEFVMTI